MEMLLKTDVARTLRCSVRTVQRLITSGKLEATEGRPVLVDPADLTKYIKSRKRQLAPTGGKSNEEIAALARQVALRGLMARKRK